MSTETYERLHGFTLNLVSMRPCRTVKSQDVV